MSLEPLMVDETAAAEAARASQFRALATPEENALRSDRMSAKARKPAWEPPSRFGFQFGYNLIIWTLYRIFAPLGDWLARPRPVQGRPLRVLRLTSMIGQGGVAKVALQTVLRLDPAQVQTHLLVFGQKSDVPAALRDRPGVHIIQRRLDLTPGSYRPRALRHIIKLARVIRRIKPDIIHVHEPQFTPIARIAAGMALGCPIVLHLHNDYRERQGSMREAQLSLYEHAARRVRLVACSEYIRTSAEMWLEKTRYPVTLIEDGTDDVATLAPQAELADDLARVARGGSVICKMAHLMPHKRIEDFMNACRILLDEGQPLFVLLMAYGKEGAAARTREVFNRFFAPHEGEFLFRVATPQALLEHVTIGISTSTLEGLGLNVLEFQLAGIPVACTDLPPHREMVIDDVNGLLFPACDVAALVRYLKRLLADPALRQRLGESGRATAAARSWARTAAHTTTFYRKVLGG